MDESFEIPVDYKGEKLLFKAVLITYGYSYKLEVEIFHQKVFLEPDEETSFRVVIPYETPNISPIDQNLLQAIVNALEEILHKP